MTSLIHDLLGHPKTPSPFQTIVNQESVVVRKVNFQPAFFVQQPPSFQSRELKERKQSGVENNQGLKLNDNHFMMIKARALSIK